MSARNGACPPRRTEGTADDIAGSDLPTISARSELSCRTREVVSRFQDAYAVVVIGKAARRHVFFGLPSAQRAVDRAHARGDFADLVLVKLTPVGEF